MGIWGIGYFENDMACDWENELDDNFTISHIENAINQILESTEETLDVDVANRAIAASESISKLLKHGGESSSFTPHIDKWTQDFDSELPKDLVEKATEALQLILNENSEIRQFWKLRGEVEDWEIKIKDLSNRLKY